MSGLYSNLFGKKSEAKKMSLFIVESKDGNKNVENIMVESAIQKIEKDDLFAGLRVFLRFGRLIGVVPVEGLMENTSEKLNFRWKSLGAIGSTVVILILSINVSVGVINFFLANKKTASEVAFSSAMAIFYSIGLFVYVYLLVNADNFIKLFRKWREFRELHFSDNKGDLLLFANVNLIAGLILTSAILENVLLFLLQSRLITFPQDKNTNCTLWEIYYQKSHTEWVRLYEDPSGSPYLGIFVFISNKLALYSWNFADILIALFSRALYSKFKKLNLVAEERLIVGNVPICDAQEWKALTYDHTSLCDLLKEFDKFLSPLIFGCYACNVFFVCLQIKMGITPAEENNRVLAFYTVWSFVHLIFRVFVVSLSAARINDHAQATRSLLQLCPPEAYSLEVQRAELRLGTSVIGLTGLRCFIITKPFLLTIVGVVFTIEIVLLQTN